MQRISGFTLIELMVAMAVIAILAAVAYHHKRKVFTQTFQTRNLAMRRKA